MDHFLTSHTMQISRHECMEEETKVEKMEEQKTKKKNDKKKKK